MHDAPELLTALTMVLCVAAVTTLLFQRLKQPVVLGYLIAGLIIGPHVPFPLVADPEIVHTLSELGVILLMFSLGLEFSLRKLFKVGPTSGLTAIIQCSLMIWLGFIAGRAFGWTQLESLFTGAIIAISSTTIIAKAFEEQGIEGPQRHIVVGVLIVEDLIAILLMALLTGLASGTGLSPAATGLMIFKLAAFLIALIGVGLLVVPRTVRAINRLGRPETTLVASLGFCFAVALLARQFGYSVALGAFLAGSLIAESGEEKQIERLVGPVKDVFGAVFFVSVGMLIDPRLVLTHWGPVVALTLVVVLGKIFSVTFGAFITGNGTRTSVQVGMSLAQIGEFSFILAALGISLGATGDFLYPVAVTVSALTTLSTPWLIKASGPLASFVDRKLPRPLQTFATLYATWLDKIKTAPARADRAAQVRRLIGLIVIDIAVLAAIIIGASLANGPSLALARRWLGIEGTVAQAAVIVVTAAVASPFCAGVIRVARRLGLLLAELAFPTSAALDLAAAPRRALVVSLQLELVLLAGVPLVAITQPFLPGFPVAALLLIAIVALSVPFWHGATQLQGHVRAGTQAVVEALATQSFMGDAEVEHDALEPLSRLLPGIGEPVPVRLEPHSESVGKTLAELNLRGVTGATVLAILRSDKQTLIPSAQDVLEAGDVLALTGTKEAIEAAKRLLARGGNSIAAEGDGSFDLHKGPAT